MNSPLAIVLFVLAVFTPLFVAFLSDRTRSHPWTNAEVWLTVLACETIYGVGALAVFA